MTNQNDWFDIAMSSSLEDSSKDINAEESITPKEKYWKTYMFESDGTKREEEPECWIFIDIEKEHLGEFLKLGFIQDDFELSPDGTGTLYLSLPVPMGWQDIDDEIEESCLDVMGIKRDWCIQVSLM